MVEERTYENFPLRIVLLSNLVSLSIYAIGAYLFARLSLVVLIFYLVYCLWVEIGVLRGGCVNCYYYGKVCGLGKGRLCSLLFRRGDPERFIKRKISWADLLPDLMVSILPLLGGIVLLVRGFSWPILVLLALLAVLSTAGNAIVRGAFACKYCKQRLLGCPAQKVFQKRKS